MYVWWSVDVCVVECRCIVWWSVDVCVWWSVDVCVVDCRCMCGGV